MQEPDAYKFVNIPKDFECSITHEIMIDPVFTSDGETYERNAIAAWLQNHNTSPNTNEELEHKQLTSNRKLKSQIQQFVQCNIKDFKKELVGAVKENNQEKLKILLNLGIQANTEINGYSALCYAILYGQNDIAQLLLSKGASTDFPAIVYGDDPQMNKAVTCRNKKLENKAKSDKRNVQCNINALHEKIEHISKLIKSYNNLKSRVFYLLEKPEDSFKNLSRYSHYDSSMGRSYERYHNEVDLTTYFQDWSEISNFLNNVEEKLNNLRKRKSDLAPKAAALRTECELIKLVFESEKILLENKKNTPDKDFSTIQRVHHSSVRSVHHYELDSINREIQSLAVQIGELEASLKKSNDNKIKVNSYSFAYKIGELQDNLNKVYPVYEEKVAELLSIYDELEKLYKQMQILNFEMRESQVKLIHLAAFLGQEAVLKDLIKKDIDINVKDEFGFTALHWAAINNQKFCIKILLEHSAIIQNDNFNCTFRQYCSPEVLKNIDMKLNSLLESKDKKLEEKFKEQELQLSMLKAQVENLTALVSRLVPESEFIVKPVQNLSAHSNLTLIGQIGLTPNDKKPKNTENSAENDTRIIKFSPDPLNLSTS